MKKNFKLQPHFIVDKGWSIQLYGGENEPDSANIAVCQPNGHVLAFVKEDDIERLAVNILTILGSKHLATLNIKNGNYIRIGRGKMK